ncbi:DUF5305 family protein [Halovivax sp.]|uniref:DUF5305 family protein n=1 Tax=Halovivax sp. TaxID=1935978 RepID=UPI0025BF9214|nr:DUF5305 family protein [Halovivax sp.]
MHDEGDRLEGESRYFTAVSPTAEGEYVLASEAPDGTADVDVEIDLVVRSTGDETVYWSDSESVAATSESAVGPGDSVSADLEVTVPELEERIDEIESNLGASPGNVELFLEASVEANGEIAGETRSVTESHRVAIDRDGGTYGFEDASFREDYSDVETVSVTVAPGPLRSIGGPAAPLVGLSSCARRPRPEPHVASIRPRTIHERIQFRRQGPLPKSASPRRVNKFQ